MNRSSDEPFLLEALLEPETPLEMQLLSIPEFRNGLLWGEPRFGHPEGKVALHVREILNNIDLIPNLDRLSRSRLRLIALAHDTFKYAEDRSRPRNWSKHHALIARRFMEQYTKDEAILDVIETHDDAFYAWLCARHGKEIKVDGVLKTLDTLFEKVGYCRQLYYLFFKCDTQTGDKTQAPIKWFEANAAGITLAPIKEVQR